MFKESLWPAKYVKCADYTDTYYKNLQITDFLYFFYKSLKLSEVEVWV